MKDPKYKPVISQLAEISHLILQIDSQVPGAAASLLSSILAAAPPD
jgi:hypothetical protein